METGSPQSLESILVAALPEDDRELLRRAAVVQYVTPDLARMITGSDEDARRLFSQPLLSGSEAVRQIPVALRSELLQGWESAEDVLRTVIAKAPAEDPLSVRLYARLASRTERSAALRDLAIRVDLALSGEKPDVGQAHDLIALLDVWPIDQDPEAVRLRDTMLAPQVHRYARGARDREVTRHYLERAFERRAKELLFNDDERWMLHLHAPGGRGKTTFLRNFLGRYCPAHGIPVARIDFDYIAHIVTVTQEPWRLLLSVARQLDTQLPNSPFRFMLQSFGEFQAQLFAEALPRRRASGEVDRSWSNDYATVSAAKDVPRSFRLELRAALERQPVVVVLDTLENVLHTEGARIDTVLDAFESVRHHQDEGVQGLRLVLSGRIDLQKTDYRPGLGSRALATATFAEKWVGPVVRSESSGDTELRVGKEVVLVELPCFSDDESMRYLEDVCGLRDQPDPRLMDTIVERCNGNPLKLALLAEQVRGEPPLTADDIARFKSVELFFLVDRVVDRLQDASLQWLLRWGVLPHVLTRDFTEQVIWPALIEFVESRHDYDDPLKDDIPVSRHDVTRWAIPALEELKNPGAMNAVWNRLRAYAAEASWVEEEGELADAVVFHPEIRDPLRRLLREGGHPAYDDIHARALDYWLNRLDTASNDERAVAVRGVVFHAYQPWSGKPADAASTGQALLQRFADDRMARGAIAAEILQVVQMPDDERSRRPTERTIATVHLELGEQLVHEASRKDRLIDETRLDRHVYAAEPISADREFARRWLFLHSVLEIARGEENAGWRSFGTALMQPESDEHAHTALVSSWLARYRPPKIALKSVEKLAEAAIDKESRTGLYAALARGLIDTERWGDALEAARAADAKDLEAMALLGQGRAQRALTVSIDKQYGTVRRAKEALYRAEAALLLLNPKMALELLADAPSGGHRFFLEGCAYELSGNTSEAMSSYSRAASGEDHLIATDATFALVKLLIDEDMPTRALDELYRLRGSLPRAGNLRKAALLATASRAVGPKHSIQFPTVPVIEPRRIAGVPPSVDVEIEIRRLEAGLTEDRAPLGGSLSRVEFPGARLLASRGLTRLPWGTLERSSRLVTLVKSVLQNNDFLQKPPFYHEPALVLGGVELLRVSGLLDEAFMLIEAASTQQGWSEVAYAALKKARIRCDADARRVNSDSVETIQIPSAELHEADTDLDMFGDSFSHDVDSPLRLRIRISTGGKRGEIHTRIDVPRSDSEEFLGKCDIDSAIVADGPYGLVKQPGELFEELGRALMSDYFQEMHYSSRHDEVLELEIEDEAAARLPWELAVSKGVPLHNDMAIVRIVRTRHGLSRKDQSRVDLASQQVIFAVESEQKDRGRSREILAQAYGTPAKALPSERLFAAAAEARVIHLVTEIAQRRDRAGIYLGGDFVTAEKLADMLSDKFAQLFVLDLVLERADVSAAEQLMLANTFARTLCTSVSGVSVLTGEFVASNAQIGRIPVLSGALQAGKSLARLAGELQRFRPNLPSGAAHPLHDAVSLVTAAPERCFILELDR